MTIIRTLPTVNADSAGLPTFAVPSATERAVYASENVLYWLRADYGYDSSGWRCMKTGEKLIPERSGMPELVNLAAYGGRAALRFASGSDQLWDGGTDWLPQGGNLSLVAVGRSGPNDNAFLLGGTSDAGDSTLLTHQSANAAAASHKFTVNAATPASTAGNTLSIDTGRYNEAGPNLIIGGYASGAANRASIRVNRGAFELEGNPTGSTGNNLGKNLHVGGINATGGAVSGAIDGGEIAEIMVLNVGLHVDTALRGQIETIMQARYGLW